MLQWLDTLIGLVVVLLAVSLIIMILTQIIVALLNLRGYNLMNGIKILIENINADLKTEAKEISKAILSHPLISDKQKISGQWKLATAISKEDFKNFLQKISGISKSKIKKEVKEEDLKNFLQNIDDNSKSKIIKYGKTIDENIDKWFDSVMTKTSQSFVRLTRTWTIIFSIIVAFSSTMARTLLRRFHFSENTSGNSPK